MKLEVTAFFISHPSIDGLPTRYCLIRIIEKEDFLILGRISKKSTANTSNEANVPSDFIPRLSGKKINPS